MVYTEDYAMGVVCGQTRTAAILVNAVDASDSCCAVLTRETKPCFDSDHTSSSWSGLLERRFLMQGPEY